MLIAGDLADVTRAIRSCPDFYRTELAAPRITSRLNIACRLARQPPPSERRREDLDEAMAELRSAVERAPFDEHRRRQVMRLVVDLGAIIGAPPPSQPAPAR
jgi:hypothetical protein